jgi:hypothetical protein
MAVEISTSSEGVVIVRASGKLSKADYEQFLPRIEALIGEHGRVSILFDMQDFHGWDAAAAWEDTKFAFHHFHDIERLAVVGDKRWQKAMTWVCRPFTRAEVRHFTHAERPQAMEWLAQQAAAH